MESFFGLCVESSYRTSADGLSRLEFKLFGREFVETWTIFHKFMVLGDLADLYADELMEARENGWYVGFNLKSNFIYTADKQCVNTFWWVPELESAKQSIAKFENGKAKVKF
ncbi:MAG: hypothetical protein J6V90_08130 [Treponema sp.]|nr:hypothetical protein [Treponema sp.]